MATLVGNQSERSKICLDQSESSIWPMWLIDVTNAHIWAWFDTWPLGIKNTRTQELNLHSWHSFNEKSLVVRRMRSGAQAFALRSHVNEIVGTCAVHQSTPQVPRMPVSLCPCGPTAHAQVMKSSPRPLASPKSRKTHKILDPHMIFNGRVANEPSYMRDVCDTRATSRPGH